MTENDPDEAVVNFCGWPRKVLTDLPADCLNGVPGWALYAIAVTLALWGIIWFFWPSIQKKIVTRGILADAEYEQARKFVASPAPPAVNDLRNLSREPPPIAPQVADVSDLRQIGDDELRRRVLEFAAEMRAFEAEYREREAVRAAKERQKRYATDDQATAAWHAEQLAYDQARAAHEKAFRRRFLAHATGMKNELYDRIGIAHGISPPAEYDDPILNNGMLAGPNPITHAASVLELLSARL